MGSTCKKIAFSFERMIHTTIVYGKGATKNFLLGNVKWDDGTHDKRTDILHIFQNIMLLISIKW